LPIFGSVATLKAVTEAAPRETGGEASGSPLLVTGRVPRSEFERGDLRANCRTLGRRPHTAIWGAWPRPATSAPAESSATPRRRSRDRKPARAVSPRPPPAPGVSLP